MYANANDEKNDMSRIVPTMSSPAKRRLTSRNSYRACPLLVSCAVLRRIASPARWTDMETLFGCYACKLSELFWKGQEEFLDSCAHLLTGNIFHDFMGEKAAIYVSAVHQKTGAMEHRVG